MIIKRIVLECVVDEETMPVVLASIEKLKGLPPKKQGFEARIIRVNGFYPDSILYTVWDLPNAEEEYHQERIMYWFRQAQINGL